MNELGLIITALRTIVGALPLDRQDETNILKALAKVEKLTGSPKVTIKKADVEAAVAKLLPDVVKAEMVKAEKRG